MLSRVPECSVVFFRLGNEIVTVKKKEGNPGGRQKKPTKKKPPTPLQKTFARNVLAARKAAGLTQRGLAARLGGRQTHVSEIEKGARNVTLSMITRYAHALGVSEVDLLTPEPEKPLKP